MTPRQLAVAVPFIKDADMWAEILNKFMPMYNINTPARIAAFLTQTGHESLDFRYLCENLNYDALGLARTWPKRYSLLGNDGKPLSPIKPNKLAISLSRQPVKIANNCYANRMGNGDEQSGDGWTYRGKGLIQLTGKNSHIEFSEHKKMPLNKTVEYLLTPEGAVESACWFWDTRKLNSYADKKDIEGMTIQINNGLIGIADRKSRYNVACNIFGV